MEPDGAVPSRRSLVFTTVVVSVAAMLMTLDMTAVSVALPEIGADLQVPLEGLQWVVNAYTLTFAGLLLAAGSSSDRLGRRRVFRYGVLTFTVASVVCALAPSALLLTIGRAIQGVGGAFVLGTAMALVIGAFSGAAPRSRTLAVGISTAAGGIAAALGPLIGGAIVESAGWPTIFWINVPLGVVLLAATTQVPETADPEASGRRIDVAGAALAVAALVALNFGVVSGSETGWWRLDGLGLVAIGVALALAFLVVQWRRGQSALLDLRFFRIPTFSGAIVLGLVARLLSFGLFPFLILWLSGHLGMSPLEIGLVLLVQSVAMAAGVPVASGLVGVLSRSRLLAVGTALGALGALLAVRIEPTDSWLVLLPTLLLLGFGAGITMPHLIELAVGTVPVSRAGMASGAANSAFPLGTSAGVAVFGAVLTAHVAGALSPDALARGGVPPSAAEPVTSLATAGRFDQIGALDPGPAGTVAEVLARSAYTSALSTVFLVAGIAGCLGAAAALVLVRDRDLVESHSPAAPEVAAPDAVS